VSEFYSVPFTKVVLSKRERNRVWTMFKDGEDSDDNIRKICPAVFAEIKKAYDYDQNIQSAVFSGCVYAQTLANILVLNNGGKKTPKN
jgi:hypothetical protein